MIRLANGEIDINSIPLDDEATYSQLKAGNSIGVFQMEGSGMRRMMVELQPSSIEDIMALISLYRPGPLGSGMDKMYINRKHGREKLSYPHPALERVLSQSYGIMLYQEDVLAVARVLAGFSAGEADDLRKCLPVGTKLLTRKRGYVPIEKIMALSDRTVQRIDTTGFHSVYDEVSDVWSVGVKPVYRVTTMSGYTIEATANHRFYSGENWVRLSELSPGDSLAVANTVRTQGGSKLTFEEARLAALLLSEGHVPSDSGGFFCNTDESLVRIFRDDYLNLFQKEAPQPKLVAGVYRVAMHQAELRLLEPILGGFGLSGDKIICDRIINAPLEKLRHFVGMYFSGDGWTDEMGMHVTSKSEQVCRSFKRIFLRFGVLSTVYSREIDGELYWTVSVCSRPDVYRLYGEISSCVTEYKRLQFDRTNKRIRTKAGHLGVPGEIFAQEVRRRADATGRTLRDLGISSGPELGRKMISKAHIGLIYSEKLHDIARGDLIWDTIKTIEHVGDKECYDFSMANPEAPYAVVEDVLTHNSIGKKQMDKIGLFRAKFVEGCKASHGVDERISNKIYSDIEFFGGYGFNRCITGDTVVYRASGNQHGRQEITVKELHDRIHGPHTPWRKKFRSLGGLEILSLESDGRIRPNKMVDVVHNGRTNVFRIQLEDGKRLDATANHRHLTPNGYVQTDALSVGDLLVVDGGDSYVSEVSAVVSVTAIGIQDVYDVCMDTPEHNFVANGIVTHNSHAASYAMISYVTAYLKTNYPAEYMAGLLTSVTDNPEKLPLYLHECRRLGLTVEPPSINKSISSFSVLDDNRILFGLSGIDGVGDSTISKVLESRNEGFSNVYDFLRNVHFEVLKKDTIQHFIASGSLDELVPPQEERTITRSDKMAILTAEKKSTGLFLTEHPLLSVMHFVEGQASHTVLELEELTGGERVALVGIVDTFEPFKTKKGEDMAKFVLEDLTGQVEVIVFPRDFRAIQKDIAVGDIIVVSGKAEKEGDEENTITKIICSDIEYPDIPTHDFDPPIIIECEHRPDYKVVDRMLELVERHPGNSPVYLRFPEQDFRMSLRIVKSASSSVREALELLGRIADVSSG